MIKRLRIKFVCINMAIVTVMLLVIFGMVFHFTKENLQRQSFRSMEMTAQNPLPPGLHAAAPNKMLLPGFVVEIGQAGELDVHGNGYIDLSEEALVQELVDRVRESDDRRGSLQEYGLRYLVHTTPSGQRIVFADFSAEIQTIKGLVRSCLIIGLISLVAFLGISIFLANWAVRPVEKAWDQQRQFVADASHELKTPLTVIMTNAELLQSEDRSEDGHSQFAQNILTMARQMRGLVESMLELARVDNGSAKMTFSEVDFSELAEDCLMRFEPVYFEKERFLEGEIAENLRIRGSRSHLQQVVDILLDNGAKYSSAGSTVSVKLRRQGGQCILSVASRGDAISKEELKLIFKRFYRVDKARSRDGSYGLGLAIAENILAEHRGKIWAESSGGINTFFVQLSLLQ